MMEGTTASLCLFLLVNQLPFCPVDAEGELSNMQWLSHTAANRSSVSTMEPNQTTNDHTKTFDMDNNTRIDCLIDTEMGLIAIGSAGGLIVCLLVTIVVLACQICQIQRRVYAPRTSRSNMCLVSETVYWGTDQPEAGGLVGPCETSVMLEEVREESQMEEEECQGETQEAEEEAAAALEDGATAMVFDLEGEASHMKSSSSRDSCLEIPRDLEDMPLVV